MEKINNSPEWQAYYEELAKHEQFIKNYRFFLDRIVNHLEWESEGSAWTTKEITERITREIDKSASMDAPSKPGYYRANND